MAAVELTEPFTMNDATVKVDADNFEKAISSVAITPTTPVATFQSIAPGGTTQRVGTPSWVVDVEFAQDWKSAVSLSRYLFENQGQTVPLEFTPQGAQPGDPKVTVNATIVAGPFGGPSNATATGKVSLPVTGQPTLDTIV